MFNNKLKEENKQLKNRVHELEEILCPCEQHEYIEVGKKLETDTTGGVIDSWYKTRYICKKCKKVVIKDDRF